MKKIVITGGSGFIGANLLKLLDNIKNYKIINIDKNHHKLEFKNIKYVKSNLKSIEKIKNHFLSANVIIYLSGISDLYSASNDPVGTVTENILPLVKILNLIKAKKNIKFMFASSLYTEGVYGSFYKVSKISSEQYIKEFSKKHNLNYIIFRFGSLYGNNADKNNGVQKFISDAISKKKINYYGNPDDLREYINILDACEVIVKYIKNDKKNISIIVSGSQSIKMKDFFELISSILDKKIFVKYLNEDDKLHYKKTPYTFIEEEPLRISLESQRDLSYSILKIIKNFKK